jgi:hypothetical protein
MNIALDVDRDFALLDPLRSRLMEQGIRAEIREHLMMLVVFRLPPALPICVFVGDGRFYCWGSETVQVPVNELERAVAVLADHVSGRDTR